MFTSTFLNFRIPGIVVETSGLLNINRRAISGIDIPDGISGFNASAWSTLDLRFSGTKYVERQSFLGNFVEWVNVPVSVPSSNGTRAMTPTFNSLHNGNKLSSGA